MDYEQYLNAMQQQINANNAWSASQAEKQMQFQERLSNTSHQREMEDLKAAGLNPILSAHSGATTPNGAMATADGSNQAMASILDKILGIEADNAKANLINASSIKTFSGYVGANTRAPTYSAGEVAGLARLAGINMNPQTAGSLNKTGYYIGEYISNYLGLPEGSNARRYLTGDWTLQDSINWLGDAVQNVKTTIKNNLSSNTGSAKANGTVYGSYNGINYRTSSATNTSKNKNKNWIVDALSGLGSSLLDMASKNAKRFLK